MLSKLVFRVGGVEYVETSAPVPGVGDLVSIEHSFDGRRRFRVESVERMYSDSGARRAAMVVPGCVYVDLVEADGGRKV